MNRFWVSYLWNVGQLDLEGAPEAGPADWQFPSIGIRLQALTAGRISRPEILGRQLIYFRNASVDKRSHVIT